MKAPVFYAVYLASFYTGFGPACQSAACGAGKVKPAESHASGVGCVERAFKHRVHTNISKMDKGAFNASWPVGAFPKKHT